MRSASKDAAPDRAARRRVDNGPADGMGRASVVAIGQHRTPFLLREVDFAIRPALGKWRERKTSDIRERHYTGSSAKRLNEKN